MGIEQVIFRGGIFCMQIPVIVSLMLRYYFNIFHLLEMQITHPGLLMSIMEILYNSLQGTMVILLIIRTFSIAESLLVLGKGQIIQIQIRTETLIALNIQQIRPGLGGI